MAVDPDFCPYVGLQPFTEEHRAYFFGREREIRLVGANLFAAKLTVLYGASGVGKSSLLMAGVVPMLRKKPRTAVVMFRQWQRADALALLKKTIATAADEAAGKALGLDSDAALDDLLAAAGKAIGGTTLLLLDQFEEYFLYYPRGGAGDGFDAEFARAVNRRDVDAGFVLSIREDSLSKLDRFRGRITTVLANPLRINHLRPQDARDAIRKPLEEYNRQAGGDGAAMSIEDPLVDTLIEQTVTGSVSLSQASASTDAQAKTGERIEAPYLQLVLMRLWDEEARAKSRVLQLRTLDALGGATKIVRTHLDKVMDTLPAGQRALCAAFFDRLVTPSGTKIACRLDDLQKWAGSGHEEEVRALVAALAAPQARILRAIDPLPGQPPQYEIFHDVLAAGVLDWRLRYVEARTREEAQAAAEKHRQETERERVRAERAERTKRKLSIFSGVVGLLSVVALVAMWFAYDRQKQAAEEADKRAEVEAQAQGLEERRAIAVAMNEFVSKRINTGSNPKATVTVPKVKGMSLEKAQRDLSALGLQSGDVEDFITTSSPPGSVLEQFPQPGQLVEAGDPVYLLAATTADLRAKKLAEAKARAEAERARAEAERARAAASAAEAQAAQARQAAAAAPAKPVRAAENEEGTCRNGEWTEWLAGAQAQERASSEKKKNRYPVRIQGRLEGGQLQFRAVFDNIPDTRGFSYSWDLYRSDADFATLKKVRDGRGFKRLCAQWFLDATGAKRWQIVWVSQ